MTTEEEERDSAADPAQSEHVWITILSGSIAATTATLAKQPIARVKFLKQCSESNTTVETTSSINLYLNLMRREGVLLGLFRGSSSACMRNIPHSILTYSLYPKYLRLLTQSDRLQSTLAKGLAGSLASMNAHLLTHPLDTVRVRIAVQYDAIQYPSIGRTFSVIYAHEGINGFYRGLSTTMVGAIVRAGIGFGMYESLKSEQMRAWDASHYPLLGRLGIGFAAGICSVVAAYPLDTLRRRQQVFGSRRDITATHSHIGGDIQRHIRAADAARFILKTEGARGFYKGLVLALVKSPLAAAVSLTVNDYVKGTLGWKS